MEKIKTRKKIKEFENGICPLCHQSYDIVFDNTKKEEVGKIKKRNIKKVIGERVRAFRLEKQLTQLRFSQLVGMDRTSACFIEAGRINISIEKLYKIADVLERSIHDFLEA